MSALLSIERDVHSRKHAKQPFDERYLELTSEPMHSKDGSEQSNAPVISDLAREVKLRATLIQAQVHDLQRQVSHALSGKAHLSKEVSECDGNGGGNEEANEAPIFQILSHEEAAKNTRILEGLRARNTATIIEVGECPFITFAEPPPLPDSSVMVQFLSNSVSKNTETIQNFAKSEELNRIDKSVSTSGESIVAPVGFFAKYLKKVKPFSFEDTEQCDNDQEVMEMTEEEVDTDPEYTQFDDSNADDWTMNEEVEYNYTQDCKANQSTMDTCSLTSNSAAQPALDDSDVKNDQDEISDDDDATGDISSYLRNGLDVYNGNRIIPANFDAKNKSKRNCLILPDFLAQHARETRMLGDQHFSQEDCNAAIYDESSKKSLTSLEFDAGNALTTSSADRKNSSDTSNSNNNKPSEIVETEAVNNNPFVTPQPSTKKKLSKHTKSETVFANHWGRFTVEDSTRYYQSLQAQCRRMRGTAKRRVRLKNRSSLLVEGAPSCGADARSILRSSRSKELQSLLDFSDNTQRQESRIYLGSLDLLLHRNVTRKSYAATLLSCTQHLRKDMSDADREEITDADDNDGENLGDVYDCSGSEDGIADDEPILDATKTGNALSNPNER